MVLVMIVSPLMSSALAGEISAQNITETEDASISIVEAQTTPLIADLAFIGGGDSTDAALAGVGVFFIILILCAAAAGSGS